VRAIGRECCISSYLSGLPRSSMTVNDVAMSDAPDRLSKTDLRGIASLLQVKPANLSFNAIPPLINLV